MSKTTRKIIAALIVIFLTLIIAAALPYIYKSAYRYGAESGEAAAYAAENEDELTKVPDYPEKNRTMTYSNTAWTIDNRKIYELVKIEDGNGNEVEKAVDAGDYTIFVKPATGCVWENGGSADEKSFPLSIEKAAVKWTYNGNTVEGDSLETLYEINENVISRIVAKGAYNFDVDVKNSQRNTYGGLEVFPVLENGELGEKINKQVQNAGEYVFRLQKQYKLTDGLNEEVINLYDNYTNPEFTLKITPIEINIGESRNLQWVSSVGELGTSGIYKYGYTENGKAETVYLTRELDNAPYPEWENWELLEHKKEVLCAVLAYCKDLTRTVELARSKPGAAQYFTAEYVGTTRAVESGEYEVRATIRPTENFNIYYEPDGTLSCRVERRSDGEGYYYEVYKTWYIALYINELLDISSADGVVHSKTAYEFPSILSSWTFGAFPEGEISLPYAAHGDELGAGEALGENGFAQPEGYALSAYRNGEWVNTGNADVWKDGEDAVVTFTLYSGGSVICEDVPRARFGYYVNKYTPVGSYSVTFTVKDISFGSQSNHYDWWMPIGINDPSCGSEYLGVSASYGFKVLAATLQFDDSEINFYGKEDVKPPFRVDINDIKGDYANFFGVASSKIKVSGAITAGEVKKSDTYWATVADKYYGEAVTLNYKLLRVPDVKFYGADAAIWKDTITEAGTFQVYYNINLPNYDTVPTLDDYSEKFFVIELYGVLGGVSGKVRAWQIILYCVLALLACAAVVVAVLLIVRKKRRAAVNTGGGSEASISVTYDDFVFNDETPSPEDDKIIEESEPVRHVEPEPVVEQPVHHAEPEPVVEQPVHHVEPEPVVEQPVHHVEPEPVVEQSVRHDEPAPVVEQPVHYDEPAPAPVVEQPVHHDEPHKLTAEEEYEADMAYIEHIMEEAQEEYDAEHRGEDEPQAEDEPPVPPVQPEEGDNGDGND